MIWRIFDFGYIMLAINIYCVIYYKATGKRKFCYVPTISVNGGISFESAKSADKQQ